MRRPIALALAGLAIAAAGAAVADEAISTAGGSAAAPPASPQEVAPLALGGRPAFDDRGPAPASPCAVFDLAPSPDRDVAPPPGATPAGPDLSASSSGSIDRRIHGAVFAGVGTGGYREGAAALCAPVGDHAAVAVSIDALRFGR